MIIVPIQCTSLKVEYENDTEISNVVLNCPKFNPIEIYRKFLKKKKKI